MAVQFTVAQYDEARAEAVEAYAVGMSEATLVTGEKNEADRKSAEYFVDLGVIWTNAPKSRLQNTERMRADIEADFEAAKDQAEEMVARLHKAQTKAAAGGDGKAPSLSESDANKNSTKGIRARRIVLENTVECIALDPKLARDAYQLAASTGKDSINWTELCAILAEPLLTRARETRNRVNVGIAADKRRRLMTEDYAKTHTVQTRELDDGTTEEFTTTTFGPKGNTEDVEVVIHSVHSGELLTMALDDIAERKKLQAADYSIVRKLQEQARLSEYTIRAARPKKSNDR